MSSRMVPIIAVAALGASMSALAQSPTDRAFTATGTQCEDVHWSPHAHKLYPGIAGACKSVVQRDGRYFVVLSGTVTRVARRGRDLTVDFKDGERITLNPPSDMKVDIEGTATRVRDLQRGQELTFYVPQDRLVAEVAEEGESVSAPIPMAPATQPHLAYASPPGAAQPAELPKTGTELGLLALGGLALVITGAGLTAARHRRSAR